jgi:hypothetical protein
MDMTRRGRVAAGVTATRVAFVIACVYAAAARAQQAATTPGPTTRARLLGVFDILTGEPVKDAEVVDIATGTKALTTETGTVTLAFLPDGGSMVRVRKVGFEPQTFWAAISPRDTAPITIAFARAGQLLPAVKTTARSAADSVPHWMSPGLREFEDRRKTGLGHFVPESVLRKEDYRTLGNVLASHIAGVTVLERAGRGVFLISPRYGSPKHPCYPDVYLNGSQLGGTGRPVNLAEFSTVDFSAIEFHNPAEAPARYSGTGSGCGVLLLWSRER